MLQHDHSLQSNDNTLTIEARRAALIFLRTCRYRERNRCCMTCITPDDCVVMRKLSRSPRLAPSLEVLPGMFPWLDRNKGCPACRHAGAAARPQTHHGSPLRHTDMLHMSMRGIPYPV
jgi:hypothetical protein